MASRVKRRELKTTFTAEDARGNTHRVRVYVDILNAAAMGNSHAESEGLPALKTEGGEAVNRIEKGKYEIVQPGEILTSDDPEAF